MKYVSSPVDEGVKLCGIDYLMVKWGARCLLLKWVGGWFAITIRWRWSGQINVRNNQMAHKNSITQFPIRSVFFPREEWKQIISIILSYSTNQLEHFDVEVGEKWKKRTFHS